MMKGIIKSIKEMGTGKKVAIGTVTLIIIAVTLSFFLPPTNTVKGTTEPKIYPNMEYIDYGIVKVTGNNSNELAANLGKLNRLCMMSYTSANNIASLAMGVEDNITYAILPIAASCVEHFK